MWVHEVSMLTPLTNGIVRNKFWARTIIGSIQCKHLRTKLLIFNFQLFQSTLHNCQLFEACLMHGMRLLFNSMSEINSLGLNLLSALRNGRRCLLFN